ncbi:MAG: leucyl/phenylalanyl-tRNA--protein transferase [Alphaproteobacteria bacterium]|nr:leucyl/phenylalanyl-tRNA--protein transferase [Alphaproteobacteria bacterium]
MNDATLTPDMLLTAYANGYFPMALTRDDPELYWFSPEERGVLPLTHFNIPRGLKRAMKTHPYRVTVDTAFEAVIRACGTLTTTRHETWINESIVQLYTALFAAGHAHSIEVWEEDKLVGGLYGVSIGGAFFGESMFSRASNASKIALVHLVEILKAADYQLLDTQYVNEHLKQFGVEAWSKARYMTKLEKALSASPNPSTRFSTASVRSGAASSSSASLTSPS